MATSSPTWPEIASMPGCSPSRVLSVETFLLSNPTHARATVLLSMLLLNGEDKQNSLPRALDGLRRAVALRPSSVLFLLSLARALIALPASARAAHLVEISLALDKALELDPQNADALVLLVTSCTLDRTFGPLQRRHYGSLLSSSDDGPPLILSASNHYALGVFFRKKEEADLKAAARLHFSAVISSSSSSSSSSSDVSGLASKSAFWLASMGAAVPSIVSRCPKEYVVSLYKGFAEGFDDLLVNSLHYETPSVLRALVEPLLEARAASCLDLGCGTGLSGLEFRKLVAPGGSLAGVDLSPEMVDKARARESVYDLLEVSDVEALPSSVERLAPFDLICACDVLVYLGDLSKVFAVARANKTPSGLFCFSVELLSEAAATPADAGYLCPPTARFTHKRSYVERASEEAGFDIVSVEESVIRRNKGVDVVGLLIVLR